ncbi:MAG: DUF1080 domain-containing protein [Bryobacterales bacterium]|nr:DUF1080 domain-containing protein [Bryobacterales bacterium]
MKLLIPLLLGASVLCAQHNTLTPKEAAEGWILLFDGETMFGWTPEMGGQWRVENGALVADSGPQNWLRTNSAFGDYVLKMDFRIPKEGNSGIFLRSAREGQPHVTGYELQIFDNQPQGFNTGGVVNHFKATDPAKLTGDWQTYEIELSGDHWLVKLDGKRTLWARDRKSLVGHIGLQFNPGLKVEFRNIKLKPLGLQPLFNGKDLRGWREVDAPKPKEKPVWSVRNGAINVVKGPGHLETEAQYADFVMQLDIRTNAQGPDHHPNSGVFFRGTPGVHWSGYESQIRNEYKAGDRTQPVDFGTGGIYHRQPTRKVIPNDNEYFTKTIVARGRHMAVWINGYPVSDWEDDRPEGDNARENARLKAGTFSLQAHDPTTNLDFRNIRVVKLP